jgi:MFS family permease
VLVLDRRVPRIARYTIARQWRAEICAGAVEGIVGIAAFAAMRSLGAGKWVAPLFVTFGQLFWLLAPMWEAAFARFQARAAFVWMGVVANIPMLAIAFVAPTKHAGWGVIVFAGAVMIQAAVDAAFVPHRAALLRANFPEAVRGRLFSMLSTVAKLSSMFAAKAGGWLMTADERWLRFVFPMAGVFGLVEHWVLSRIYWHRHGRPAVRESRGAAAAWTAAKDAWRETRRILSTDREFLVYEVGFMLYGAGVMMGSPIAITYAEHDLGLSYDEYTWAQGFSQPLAYVVMIFFFGRIVDRVGVLRTTTWSFAMLAVFYASMLFATSAATLIACFAVLGAAMAAVNIGWNLGPLALAPQGRARSYSTIHVLCVGVRSAVAPFVGLWIAGVWGAMTVFAFCSALVALGAVTIWGLSRRTRRGGPASAAPRGVG